MTADFDPALIRFEYEGAPHTGPGLSLVMWYGDEKHYPNTLLEGIRTKYPLPEHGVMIKVEQQGRLSATGTSVHDSGQGFSEWLTWQHAPEAMRELLQPTLHYAVCKATRPGWEEDSPERTIYWKPRPEAICWVAQEWAEPHPKYRRPKPETYGDMTDVIKSHGFTVHDGGTRQCMVRADGRKVFLDYGGWGWPDDVRHKIESVLYPERVSVRAKLDDWAPLPVAGERKALGDLLRQELAADWERIWKGPAQGPPFEPMGLKGMIAAVNAGKPPRPATAMEKAIEAENNARQAHKDGPRGLEAREAQRQAERQRVLDMARNRAQRRKFAAQDRMRQRIKLGSIGPF